MPNDIQVDDFQIENFEPRHLKKARVALDKHLKTAKKYARINDEYKKNIFKIPNIWDRIKHTLHLDNL